MLRPLVFTPSSTGDIPVDVSYIVIGVRISPRPNGSAFVSAKVAGAVTALVVDDVALGEREEEVTGDGTARAAEYGGDVGVCWLEACDGCGGGEVGGMWNGVAIMSQSRFVVLVQDRIRRHPPRPAALWLIRWALEG